MKVLLVISDAGGFPEMPHYGMLNIASYLEELGHTVDIVDRSLWDNFQEVLKAFKPDVVGISAITPGINDAIECASISKAYGCYTVLGGRHPSALPEEAIRFVDAVVVGEGEKTLAHLIESREKGIIKGEPFLDLDKLPLPAYHLIDMEHYTRVRRKVWDSILTYADPCDRLFATLHSRGCPFNCTFCYNSFKDAPVRYRSAEKIIEEVKLLINKYKVQTIHFHDDDFLVNKKRLEKICSLLESEKIKMYWSANSRVTDVTEDTLEMCKNTGLVQLAFGFESAVQRILDILRKKIKVEDSVNAIDLCNKHGVIVQGSFMIGNPTETTEEIFTTINFMKEHNIDGGLGAARTTPFPGTELWNWCKEKNILPDKVNWREFNYNQRSINMTPINSQTLSILENLASRTACELCMEREPSRITKLNKVKERLRIGRN
jgi:radical SAM superfamily enzyme YgiQ (UPF0313 family)